MDDPRKSGAASGSQPPSPRERDRARAAGLAEGEFVSLSPEARRRARALRETPEPFAQRITWRQRLIGALGPGSRAYEVVRRTLSGTYNDGFMHAGNLAYLAMLSIFPFFILAGALFRLVGGMEERRVIIETVVLAMPPTVQNTIAPVAENVIDARSGWLLWLGAAAGLWSVSSLIETIRDVLRRAYGTERVHAFWRSRLASAALIIGAVVLLLLSLFASVALSTAQQIVFERVPGLAPGLAEWGATIGFSRIVPALGLLGSMYLLFWSLTPVQYSARRFPKWPGAAFTTVWWLAAAAAMPRILQSFLAYNLTYGSLAGIMIALFFFWLVGLGIVIGAELNAALAEPEGGDPADEETTKEDAA
ncbi:MAG: YihY/virulence factor BrkB family protein [Erythrobacter sp.]|uniref:YihY/virulence factor BrkB family protein n=1 Tax=Erythrobacter sp. TaxID=1042 RepID=UPI00260A0BFE|nr:YihY/virulence factor BrkB family protein [Erythrobacter sp.]MDJ0978391.1 YihY/virulence factor BrkB family protein [Erythrobacter sp.]